MQPQTILTIVVVAAIALGGYLLIKYAFKHPSGRNFKNGRAHPMNQRTTFRP